MYTYRGQYEEFGNALHRRNVSETSVVVAFAPMTVVGGVRVAMKRCMALLLPCVLIKCLKVVQ